MASEYYGKIEEHEDDGLWHGITVTQDTEQGNKDVGKNNNHFIMITDMYIPMYSIITDDVMFGNQLLVLGSAYIGCGDFQSTVILFTSRPEDEVDVSKLKKGTRYSRLFYNDEEHEPNCLPFYRYIKNLMENIRTPEELDVHVMMREMKELLHEAGKNAFYEQSAPSNGWAECLGG